MLKEINSGKVWVTGPFRKVHGKVFALAGHDLRKPFDSDHHFLHAAIDTLDDETCDALAEALGLMNRDEEGSD